MKNLTFKSLVTSTQTRAITNSGCTSHLLGANTPCTDKIATTNGILVGLPNGANMQATHTALLLFPQLSLADPRANISLGLQNRVLISIGQLCDDGFFSTFRKDHLTLVKKDITITGNRDANNGLYYTNLASCSQPTVQKTQSLHTSYAHSAYSISTKGYLVCYLHLSAFSPVISTWTSAIDAGYYTTWPGLTSQLVHKHLPKALETAQVYLRQQRRNVRSTKITTTPSIYKNMPEMTTPSVPPPEPHVRTKMAFFKSIKVTGNISTYQTGRFSVTSSRGSK